MHKLIKRLINYMNRKTLSKALAMLPVHDGDIITVTTDDLERSGQIATAISELRNKMKLPKCLIVVLQKGDKLERFDSEQMLRMGWIRRKNGN